MAHIKSDFRPLGQDLVSPWLDHRVDCSEEACWSHWCDHSCTATWGFLVFSHCFWQCSILPYSPAIPMPVHGMLPQDGCEDPVFGLHQSSTAVAAVDGVNWCSGTLTMVLCILLALPLQHSMHNSPLPPCSSPPPPILKQSDILEIG